MKKLDSYRGYGVVRRGKVHITYELLNGGKTQASFKSLSELYQAVDRRYRRLDTILIGG